MCRIYESKNGPYTRLCYRTGQPGRHLPGRLGTDIPATPSGLHVASTRTRSKRGRKDPGTRCIECNRRLWAGSTPPLCAKCCDSRLAEMLAPDRIRGNTAGTRSNPPQPPQDQLEADRRASAPPKPPAQRTLF